MKFILSILLFFYSLLTGWAQPVRYQDQVFENTSKKTFFYAIRGNQHLGLDIYQPNNDPLELKRPVVIFVHGGGFQNGQRDESLYEEFCRGLARKGYVAVSISYRLYLKGKSFHCDQPSAQKIEAFRQAVNDLRSATAFMIKKAHEFKIDISKVVLVGSSAGAYTVLHAAFWDNAHLIEDRKVLKDNFSFAGVISMAGAVLDTTIITDHNAPPIMLFHGTCDDLVPYASAPHHYCEEETPGALMLHGAYSIARRYQNLGESHLLYSFCGADHEIATNPLSDFQDEISDFIYQAVIQGEILSDHLIITGGKDCAMPQYDFCQN